MLVCDRKKRYLPQIPQHSITSHFHLLSCLIMIRAKGTRPQKNTSFPPSLAGGRAVGHAHLLQRPLGPWKTLRPSDGCKGNAGAALPHPLPPVLRADMGRVPDWIFFPRKAHRWSTDMWKDAQHHYASVKCKSKPQWDIASTCQDSYCQKDNKGFPGGSVVKNLPANAGDTSLTPGPGRFHIPRSN